jgi:hypothetical protein
VISFFFQNKKQKALFGFAEFRAILVLGLTNRLIFFLQFTHKMSPCVLTRLAIFFFFQKKKQKALFCFAEVWAAQNSAKPTLGVWGRAPSKTLR